jgi:hypothetical protein
MKLNDNQKKFLFDKYYVDAKVLDSAIYAGWEDYWINNYDFELDTDINRWNMRTLSIIDKDPVFKCQDIVFDLNFQDNDFETLLAIQ